MLKPSVTKKMYRTRPHMRSVFLFILTAILFLGMAYPHLGTCGDMPSEDGPSRLHEFLETTHTRLSTSVYTIADNIDTFFADKIRSVENLSGGESFLVSLSLALGLSDITSKRTNIESLFLDEGFGTLDAETLETALAAIDALNASGKTVGIISHIETLKERIFNKIEIKPMSDGTSRIYIAQL